ncbi:MAG: hypothetical protein KTR15_07735 [Phycisphaeraceae bacterium]|nr:hypothetical protein [Phycisphaeraceae bacterium]
MAEPPTTRLHIDPPIDRWRVAPRNGRTTPVIATGHQPLLWHPGILVKDLAADVFAQHVGGSALHVVVEHNAIGPLAIEVPTQRGKELSSQSLVFGNTTASTAFPPNRLPPIDPAPIHQAIRGAGYTAALSARAGLDQIAEAFAEHADLPNRSAQISAVLATLKQPYLHQPMRRLPTSQLVTQGFVDRLLADPSGCVRAYNRAARAYPEAGIRPLYLGRDVVEAPLWAQGEGASTPVFVDIGDSKQPTLFTQGQSLDLTGNDVLRFLRPRAVTLSAIMRSELCDLFIHGTGGRVYDQVTERWWHDWTGEDLAPKAVVSADAVLDLDVPVATRAQHIKAQWLAHHLPHNVDRFSDPKDDAEAALRHEKRELLDRMDDDRDRRRRARAFVRVHAINAGLRDCHADIVKAVRQDAQDTRLGLLNAAIARRRDWCFALYPGEQLHDLADQINSRLAASPG